MSPRACTYLFSENCFHYIMYVVLDCMYNRNFYVLFAIDLIA